MNPYLQDADLTLYNGDALEVLRSLPDESVHMCVTSPPFYGLRDYGTGRWEGGNDPDCEHVKLAPERIEALVRGSTLSNQSPDNHEYHRQQYRDECGKCGASRVDQQIGLEASPEQWVEALVAVFREVRRVLRGDGTLWLEIGDSYAGSPGGSGGWDGNNKTPDGQPRTSRHASERWKNGVPNLKAKDLIGAPWLLAFALRADGWYLRSDVVWSRPNPMPESVTDRPTKSHSYVFLLSKSARYFFDQEAVREGYDQGWAGRVDAGMGSEGRIGGPGGWSGRGPDGRKKTIVEGQDGSVQHRNGERWPNPSGRNVRSVWTIATEAYPDAHFATYPQELVRRCILAGSSERGCCPECGAPWVRETEVTQELKARNVSPVKYAGGADGQRGGTWTASTEEQTRKRVTTLGWRASCHCGHERGPSGEYGGGGPRGPIPCTVLDPFAGSGTTGLVARKHGRRSILIELSSEYCGLVASRTQQLSLEGEIA